MAHLAAFDGAKASWTTNSQVPHRLPATVPKRRSAGGGEGAQTGGRAPPPPSLGRYTPHRHTPCERLEEGVVSADAGTVAGRLHPPRASTPPRPRPTPQSLGLARSPPPKFRWNVLRFAWRGWCMGGRQGRRRGDGKGAHGMSSPPPSAGGGGWRGGGCGARPLKSLTKSGPKNRVNKYYCDSRRSSAERRTVPCVLLVKGTSASR